ncbi:MAG: outer membrane lipoprotein-sorting protein [Deltaproteobacteria bacterium]|nr:outer membrane lipoprotein-sorting protein [Deltaproteobacteria bacterium]
MLRVFTATVSLILILVFPVAWSSGEDEDPSVARAKKILREVDDMWRGTSSHSVLTMQVKTVHYTRDMRMEGWSLGKDMTLVRILSPLKDKGLSTLKSGNDIYSYLPKTDRTIKLSSHMMMSSWMGSHFTNDDLVKESRMEEDYDPTISYEGIRDGQEVIEFTLIPKPDAPVVWGKIVATVLADGYMPVKYLYYDEDMLISRTMTFSRFEMLGERIRPKVMRVVPSDKPEEYTELVYEELELDIDLDEDFFSISSLKRM